MRPKAAHLLWLSACIGTIWFLLNFYHGEASGSVKNRRDVVSLHRSNLDFLRLPDLSEDAEFADGVTYGEEMPNNYRSVATHSEEVRHIAFVKVHKTASSTAQNVFLRFGDSRKLNFILPHTKGESGWPNVISYNHSITNTNILDPPKGEHFDIICCHVLYNREQFERVLPKDTVYIGIVREPVSRFQSAIKFFSPRYILNIPGPHPLSEYLKNPTKYEHTDPRQSQLNNRMATEFDFPLELYPGKSLQESSDGIHKFLDKLDKEFEFVIISERFDESMVMMRRLLNWTMKDVLYLDLNVGVQKPNTKKLLQEDDIVPLRKFLYLDEALYNWALTRFNKQLEAEGEDFEKEMVAFQKTRKKLIELCKSKRSSVIITETPWNEQFAIFKSDCAILHKHEKELIHKQRMRMYGTDDN